MVLDICGAIYGIIILKPAVAIMDKACWRLASLLAEIKMTVKDLLAYGGFLNWSITQACEVVINVIGSFHWEVAVGMRPIRPGDQNVATFLIL